nr:reverse transcriptase domain-containing protein [Tanacetum cinerariifolium]
SVRGWFENLLQGSIARWVELRQQFTTRFSTRRARFKDPTEITKIVRKANETLVAFKERWIVEIGSSRESRRRALALSEPKYSLRCEDLPQQIGAIHGTLSLLREGLSKLMSKPPLTKITLPAREKNKGHLSALRSLLKGHNGRGNVPLIRLSFEDAEDRTRVRTVVTRKEIGDANLKRPFKEADHRYGGPSQSVLIRSKLREMAHADVVSYVPTNPGWECEGMV